MKELFIGGEKVVMDQTLYFPFTHKIQDINNVSIMNFPATKTIQIPRCPINDEIFGYVAELSRIAVGYEDFKVGISFNQIKKVKYELYNDSILISDGIVRIVGITEENYEIELYDKMIELLTELNGEEDTGKGFLNDMDLIVSGQSFSMKLTADNVKELNDLNGEVLPTANISTFLYKGAKSIYTIVSLTGGTYRQVSDLQEDMTPIQFRTLKPYDFEYTVPISTVINSINAKYSGVTEITYDTYTKNIFDSVRFNLGKPKVLNNVRYSTASGGTWYNLNSSTMPYQLELPFNSASTSDIILGTENGKYYLQIPIIIDWTANSPNFYYSHQVVDGIHYNYSVLQIGPAGGYIGSAYITSYITTKDGVDEVAKSSNIITELKMNTNTIGGNTLAYYNGSGEVTRIVTAARLPIPIEYYYSILNNSGYTNYLNFSIETPDMFRYFEYGTLKGSDCSCSITMDNFPVKLSNTNLRTGDYINGFNLFPKISVQSFLLNILKYYNLGIELDRLNNRLHIFKKEYVLTSDVLAIDEITNIQISNFDFSKVVLSTNTTSNSNYKNYETDTKKKYGEQVVNTGYSIRNTKKEIKFDIAVPGIMKDINNYAYSVFGDYYNYGYSKTAIGVTEGLENNLTIGYASNALDNLWVSDDLPYEANMTQTIDGILYEPTELGFIHNNLNLKYYEYNSKFSYPIFDVTGTTSRMLQFYTFSPYELTYNYVSKSVEMNKPLYNFADITDQNYSINKTHYNQIFSKYIADIYNVNTHELTTKMYINGLLDIYKIYNYRNSYYIISEIVEYDPTIPDIYEIKLLRVNDLSAYRTTNVSYSYNALATMLLEPACYGTPVTVYSNYENPGVGDYFYVDENLTTPWTEGSLIYIDSYKKTYAVAIVETPEYKQGVIMATMDYDCSIYSGITTTTTTPIPGGCVQINQPLKFSFLSAADACSQTSTSTYYGNNVDFSLTTKISANKYCTVTLGGYYSNGVIWKYTNDGNNFIASGNC